MREFLTGPWADPLNAEAYGWILWMGFLVNATCGLLGNYLILRRMALVGDAISHSILPGLALAFLVAHSLEAPVMFVGAVLAGVLATAAIEFIHGRSKVKADAAIGITFTTLFAVGVVLINLFAGRIHLDPECVLYGDLNFLPFEPERLVLGGLDFGPLPVGVMFFVALLVILLIFVFYKELLLSSFDASLAGALGFSPRLIHYLLMAVLSLVVVGSFEAVGAILVIAMLILPGATAQLLSNRLPRVLVLSVLVAGLSAVGGLYMGVATDVPIAAAMVVVGSVLFVAAWFFGPREGLVWRQFGRMNKPGAAEEPAGREGSLLAD